MEELFVELKSMAENTVHSINATRETLKCLGTHMGKLENEVLETRNVLVNTSKRLTLAVIIIIALLLVNLGTLIHIINN